MPTLREFTIDDLIASLDEWEDFACTISTDLFVGAIGFEDRSSVCFNTWCTEHQGKTPRALLINYPFNVRENKYQAERFDIAASSLGITPTNLLYNRLKIFGEILAIVRNNPVPKHILLDISSMASFAFYPVLAGLLEVAPNAELTVCYTEAVDYFPSLDEWQKFQKQMKDYDLLERARLFDESHFQSKGVDSVYEAVNFPGRNSGNMPTKLIVIPNFSFERVNRMIDHAVSRYHCERSDCEWIIGMPPNQAKNAWRYDALWEMYNKPNAKRDASTLHYKEMLLTLHQVWRDHYLSESLVIATTGSKAQHLATFLFLLMHPEVGLVLAEPREFNASRYSAKAGRQWSLKLGVVNRFVSNLKQWNRLSFEWD